MKQGSGEVIIYTCHEKSQSHDACFLRYAETQDDVLEASVCKALLLTGLNIALGDLHACHRMKRLDRIINLVNKNSQ